MRAIKIKDATITPRENEVINLYFQDVRRYPLLSVQEEEELAYKAQAGDKKAFEKLVNSNLRFVISVANKYLNCGMPQADLISHGNIGLIRAAQTFDPSRGLKFTSHAIWHIRAAIQVAIGKERDLVYIPSNKNGDLARVYRFNAQYEVEHGIQPTPAETAEALEMSEVHVRSLLNLDFDYASMSAPLPHTDGLTLGECLSGDSSTEAICDNESLQEEIRSILSAVLPKREQDIVELYFGLNGGHSCTLAEISDRFGLSLERVRQLKSKALQSIRKSTKSARLRMFL